MSIIAVEGFPLKWPLTQVVKACARPIAGKFEALNFVNGPGKNRKTCYLRLSEMLDPLQVVERLNNNGIPKLKITAFIPDDIPDIPLAAKPKTVPFKLARSLRIQLDDSPQKILIMTHTELMTELQTKFTGLFNLSRKTPSHSLLYTIAETLFERLHKIMLSNADAASTCFKLSRAYRRLHPHFGDFQLLLGALHRLQAARAAPRSQLTEDDLMLQNLNASPFAIDNIPFDKVQAMTSKYSLKITKKVLEHIRNLDVEEGGDSEEDVARRKVRKELQNVAQHLPSIIRQVIQKHLSPEKSVFQRMRVYGEPGIPSKEQMTAFARRFRAVRVARSGRMYNLITMNVPPEQYGNLMAQDGASIGGAKLVIRPSDVPLYKVPAKLKCEMAAVFGAEHDLDEYAEEEDEDDEMDAEDAA